MRNCVSASKSACSADPLGVEQQLVLGREHAHLGEHPPLVGEQRRVDAAAGRDARDVVGEQRVEVGGGVRAADRELAALGAVDQRDALGRGGVLRGRHVSKLPADIRLRVTMSLAADFTQIVDSLPDDWTDLELDLRIADETRYVDAAVFLVVANAQPYSKHDWHWRLLVAHRFGHAAAVAAVHMALGLLDDAGIDGELALREVREGRVPVESAWGRPQSLRDELRQINAQ